MKQIYLHFLPAVMAVLTLTGCENEDIEPASDVAATFTATIDGVKSRAIGTSWEAGDEIGISSSSVYNVCHVVTKTVKGDTVTVKNQEEQIYYSSLRTSTETFNAYYPYIAIDNPDIANNRTININTSDQTKQKSFDFLFASAKGSKNAPDVKFEFEHKMSKLTFVFKNGQGMDVSTITSYSLDGFVMDGTFDVGSCTAKTGTTATTSPVTVNLTDVQDGEEVTPCILFPQTAKSDPTIIITDRDGGHYTCKLTFSDSSSATTQKKIEAGKNYKFTITVNNRYVPTVSDRTIENWIDKDGGKGTAGSADYPNE